MRQYRTRPGANPDAGGGFLPEPGPWPRASPLAQKTSETTPTAGETTSAPDATTQVTVMLGSPQEFSLTADAVEIPAGTTTFTVENKGAMMHEMVIVPAPDGAEALKLANGEADETGASGEVANLPAGETGTITVTLPAGK